MEHNPDNGHPAVLLFVRMRRSMPSLRLTRNSYIVIEKRELTVSVAFTSISLFTMVRMPLNIIPTYVSVAILCRNESSLTAVGGHSVTISRRHQENRRLLG